MKINILLIIFIFIFICFYFFNYLLKINSKNEYFENKDNNLHIHSIGENTMNLSVDKELFSPENTMNLSVDKELFSGENTIKMNVYFIDKNELINILHKDSDNYYKSFLKNDLIARKISSVKEYYNYINNSISNFTKEEKEKILRCIKIANEKIYNIKLDWFDGLKANLIDWNIGCMNSNLYENGLPHTRNDIILISKNYLKNNDIRIIKTLIHEKVHIYQKKYKDDSEKFIKYYNYTIIKEKDENDNIRANPDLNNFIYKDKNNNINKAVYNKNPINIEDIIYYPINNQSYEHPYEKMAIDIENYVKVN